MTKFEFTGVEFVSCDYPEAINLMLESLNSYEQRIFSHFNLYNFYLFKQNSARWKIPEDRNTYFLEGIYLKISLFFRFHRILPDINGTDLSIVLLPQLPKNNSKVFLMGADENTILLAKENLIANYNLNIVGWHNGYFDLDYEANLVAQINSSSADILISGMGFKNEMEFLQRNIAQLKVKIIWNVGGLFDFVSGKKKRAPEIIRYFGFEWLYRLILEPKKKLFRNLYPPFWFLGILLKTYIVRNLKSGK